MRQMAAARVAAASLSFVGGVLAALNCLVSFLYACTNAMTEL
jgi:hypothetical protein